MPLDDDDKKLIGDLIKSGLTDFGAELDKKFVTADSVADVVKTGLGELNLTEQITNAVSEATKDLKAPPKKKEGGDGEVNPEVAKMEERVAEMERKSREADQAREQAEARMKENRLNGSINEALATAGVGPTHQAQARAYLRTLKTDKGEPVLGFDDSGQPVYRLQKQGYVDKKSMADGLKAWVETDAGKLYLPPTNTSGTGEGGGKRQPHKTGATPRKSDGSADWGTIGQGLSTASLGRVTGA